jgi:glycosyltransferase involved in cell wall biosynthesis
MNKPLVSIITPVYNASKYIHPCIESVLSQNYDNIEHVFTDGGSSDGTVEVLAAYHRHFPHRVRYVSERDRGPGDGWNKGLKIAKGAIFGCLGADDLYESNAIQTVVDFFNKNPEASFVHGHCDYVNEKGELVRRHHAETFQVRKFVNTAKHVATPAAFYRREVMEAIGWLDSGGGGFDASRADDFDVMIRIVSKFQVHCIDQVLAKLMLRSESFFSPNDLDNLSKVYRQTYSISRRYGGGLTSPLALRYYLSGVLKAFHLHGYFPQLRTTLRRLRGIPSY